MQKDLTSFCTDQTATNNSSPSVLLQKVAQAECCRVCIASCASVAEPTQRRHSATNSVTRHL